MVESNTALGDSYSIVYKDANPIEFRKAHEVIFGLPQTGEKNAGENVVAIVLYSDGSRTVPLYKGQASYIMTENGATFSGRLTSR